MQKSFEIHIHKHPPPPHDNALNLMMLFSNDAYSENSRRGGVPTSTLDSRL